MSAALALPGIGGKATAATPVSAIRADYRFSDYKEADLPSDKLSAGSDSRYKIETHQLDVRAPLAFRVLPDGVYSDVEINLLHESMSGASPWYVRPENGTDKPVQVMSGATIDDSRDDIFAQVNLYRDGNRVGMSVGYSEEDDYESINLGLEGETDFNDGATTLEAGLGYDDDSIRPTQDGPKIRARVRHESKDQWTVFAGITQVIDARSVIQTSASYTQAEGYLSDPYKLAFVAGSPLRDTRPDRRRRFVWLTRYRYYLEWSKAALHADYRFYHDDWDITAHTLELGAIQPLGDAWKIAPRLRYYSQGGASFYAPFFDTRPDDNLFSSDYRLAPFGAISWRLDVSRRFGRWLLNLAYEDYDSDASLALKHVKAENPGLVDYRVVSVSLKVTFD